MKRFSNYGTGIIFSLFMIYVFAGILDTGWAHETDHGRGNEEMSAHMQAMREVKEKIPQEYRIMDRTPVTPTPRSLSRGKEVYLVNCAACHGKKGNGQGPAAAGMKTPPADFLDLEHSAIYAPGEKYWIIGNGSGMTGMPAFHKLSPADRWHVVNYILSLQKPVKGKINGNAGH